ncbi:DUF6514 family protein [Clostridium hydrogeniformans]|uniref:DUF6514 family protein n=1 Tax=Clostridium hydrogeniformans TaxID=349933 RepID=UPI000486D424|nr:DUF6514 family protein [Clostridium hydrogeniformans]
MVIVEQLTRADENEGKNMIYSYRMIKKIVTLPFYDLGSEVQCFGIEVERQDLINGVVVSIERDWVEAISPYRHKVRDLLKLLYDNKVSPLHLVDILSEYIDEYVLDFNESEFLKVCTN